MDPSHISDLFLAIGAVTIIVVAWLMLCLGMVYVSLCLAQSIRKMFKGPW